MWEIVHKTNSTKHTVQTAGTSKGCRTETYDKISSCTTSTEWMATATRILKETSTTRYSPTQGNNHRTGTYHVHHWVIRTNHND